MSSMNKILSFFLFSISISFAQSDLPETGISGVYEVIMGTEDLDYAKRYFGEFGFHVVDSSELSASEAEKLYQVPSAAKVYRMQNGSIDSHGLLRIIKWEKPLGEGVGYAQPETIGQRMAVMRTKDIFRLYDVYKMAREEGKEPWLVIEPIADDLFGLDGKEKKGFFNRPVIVRETGIYGEFFNHVFFQRYGYHIPGYGTIGDHSPLKTSEFTHHDFIIKVPSMDQLSYLSTALGLKAEKPPSIDGEWQKGPKRVFQMEPGYSHWYQGFVSPNNICGKLKFFLPRSPRPDRSANQRMGEAGITMHSFYTPKLKMVHQLVEEHNLNPSKIQKNEFQEKSFFFVGPEGSSWQILEMGKIKNKAVTELEFKLVHE